MGHAKQCGPFSCRDGTRYNVMARTIAIANNKGGCGKTTTAANVAAALRLRGRDVLVIDADGQANLTAYLGVSNHAPGCTTFDAMRAPTTPFVEPVRVLDAAPANGSNPAPAGVLDVLPAVPDLSAVEAGLVGEPDRLTRFRTVADKYRTRYDCIIIDTPPAVGTLTVGALYAADAVIITVQPEFLAVQGLLSLTRAIDTLNANGANIDETRVLFTRYDRRKGLHRLTVEQVEAAGFRSYRTRIRDNVALGEAPAAGVDIFRYAPRSYGATDYGALADEIQASRPLDNRKQK